LNKQYSPDEYKELRAKIIAHMKKTGEWGKFFPKELSPFAYNESTINEYYPLTKEGALARGYRWQDNIPATTGQETKKSYELPTDPNEYSDVLANEILACATCAKNFRLIPREIEFYKSMRLPLPLDCYNCRHARRMKMRLPRQLFDGKCAKCEVAFKTSYPIEQQSQYKIYCEACYKAEMM
jgi:hypothetical protein